MPAHAFIFDLDGTLLDTLADLAGACNRLLASRGLPERPVPAYRQMVGNGFRKLVERALPDGMAAAMDEAELTACVDEGKRNYTAHLMDGTAPYPGMTRAVDALAALGCRMAVLSNKPEPMTRALVEHFFPGRFAVIRGGRPGVPLKPDPQAVLEVLAALGTDAASTLYVGDSDVDMITAKNAGLTGIGVAWGFRGAGEVRAAGARAVIDDPMELVALTGA